MVGGRHPSGGVAGRHPSGGVAGSARCEQLARPPSRDRPLHLRHPSLPSVHATSRPRRPSIARAPSHVRSQRTHYCYSEAELRQLVDSFNGGKYTTQRFKVRAPTLDLRSRLAALPAPSPSVVRVVRAEAPSAFASATQGRKAMCRCARAHSPPHRLSERLAGWAGWYGLVRRASAR